MELFLEPANPPSVDAAAKLLEQSTLAYGQAQAALMDAITLGPVGSCGTGCCWPIFWCLVLVALAIVIAGWLIARSYRMHGPLAVSRREKPRHNGRIIEG